MRARIMAVVGAMALLVASLPAQPAVAISPVPVPTGLGVSADRVPATTTIAVPFDKPTTLTRALALTAGRTNPVVAFRYTAPGVVGEYSPHSGTSPESFLKQFAANFGTQPRITSFSEVQATFQPGETLKQAAKRHQPTAVATHAAPFTPPNPTPTGSFGEFRSQADKTRSSSKAKTASPQPSETSNTSTSDWRPNDFTARLTDDLASGNRLLYEDYEWYGGDSPALLEANFGLEFDVDLWDDAGVDYYGTRDGCAVDSPAGPGHPAEPTSYPREHNWGQNQNWVNWTVITPYGDDMNTIGAYADYNDLYDDCARNAMTIGLRHPGYVYPAGVPGEPVSISILIEAPAGIRSSALVGGEVQAVDDLLCTTAPWMSLTDCMGAADQTPGDGISERITLKKSRGWRAPTLCWSSGDKGLIHSSTTRVDCPKPDGLSATAVTDTSGSRLGRSFVAEHAGAVSAATLPYLGQTNHSFPSDAASDVHAWIAGAGEVPVTGSVSLDLDSSGLYVDVWGASFGDNSNYTLRHLLNGGALSFRVDDGDVNVITFSGLGGDFPASADGADDLWAKSYACWGQDPTPDASLADPATPSESDDPMELVDWSYPNEFQDPTTQAFYNDGSFDGATDMGTGCEYDYAYTATDASRNIMQTLPGWSFDMQTDHTAGVDQDGRPVVSGTWGIYTIHPDAGSDIELSYAEHYQGTDSNGGAAISEDPETVITVPVGENGTNLTVKYQTYSDYYAGCDYPGGCDYFEPQTGHLEVNLQLNTGDSPLGTQADTLRKIVALGGQLRFTVGGDPVTFDMAPQHNKIYSWYRWYAYNTGQPPCDCSAS